VVGLPALAQPLERVALARGVHERGVPGGDLRLAAVELEGGRLAGALQPVEPGLRGHEVGPTQLRVAVRADVLAGAVALVRRGAQQRGAVEAVGEAGGVFLLGLVLGALAQGTDTLEPEREGWGTHAAFIGRGPRVRRRLDICSTPDPASRARRTGSGHRSAVALKAGPVTADEVADSLPPSESSPSQCSPLV
jgi:hypothetical protein